MFKKASQNIFNPTYTSNLIISVNVFKSIKNIVKI